MEPSLGKKVEEEEERGPDKTLPLRDFYWKKEKKVSQVVTVLSQGFSKTGHGSFIPGGDRSSKST